MISTVRGAAGIMGLSCNIVVEFFKALWSSELMFESDPEIVPLPFRMPVSSKLPSLQVSCQCFNKFESKLNIFDTGI